MKYILYALTVLYAVLSSAAAIVQIKTAEKKGTSFMMLGGGIVLIAAVILHILNIPYIWIAVVIGALLICAAAFLNGKRNGFHIAHHLIRLIISGLLTAGFILF